MKQKAFTLVELAIVITIIGLLIGGVLKGQEMLENARMTSAYNQIKGYTTAIITFKDIYKALPGDIANPSNFLKNCTTAPCSNSGNADGQIGALDNWHPSTENGNAWVHLGRAELVNGIDPSSTFSAGATFTVTAPNPPFPLGGKVVVGYLGSTSNVQDGGLGHYFSDYTRVTDSLTTSSIPRNKIAKFDLKFDDGRPRTGDIVLGFVASAPTYDPNETASSSVMIKQGF